MSFVNVRRIMGHNITTMSMWNFWLFGLSMTKALTTHTHTHNFYVSNGPFHHRAFLSHSFYFVLFYIHVSRNLFVYFRSFSPLLLLRLPRWCNKIVISFCCVSGMLLESVVPGNWAIDVRRFSCTTYFLLTDCTCNRKQNLLIKSRSRPFGNSPNQRFL